MNMVHQDGPINTLQSSSGGSGVWQYYIQQHLAAEPGMARGAKENNSINMTFRNTTF
jgi:hypothetical protein